MSEIKNLFKNTTWMFLSNIILNVCSFIWTILLARYLSVNDFGILSFAMSFSALMTLIIDLGIALFATRDMSRDNNLISEYIGKLIPLKMILAIFSIILSIIILLIMGKNRVTIFVSIIFIVQAIFISFDSLIQGSFQAVSKIRFIAIGGILTSIITLSFIIFVIFFNYGLIFISIAYLFGYLVTTLYLYGNMLKHVIKPKLGLDFKFYKYAILNSIPFALTILFTTLYFSIDTIMLSVIIGDFSTGIYNASYKIINVLVGLFPIYQTVFFPLMSKLFKESDDLLKLSFAKSIKYLLLFIIPISLFVAVYANQILNLIYGSKYSVSTGVMQILIWVIIFLFINAASSTLLNASDKESSVTKIYGVVAFINFGLNLIFIPFLSYIGAALTTVISEIIISILMIYEIKKTPYLPNNSILKDIIKIIFACLILSPLLIFIKNMWIGLIVSFIVYMVLIIILKIFDNDDKMIIKEILS